MISPDYSKNLRSAAHCPDAFTAFASVLAATTHRGSVLTLPLLGCWSRIKTAAIS
jgi:hypothetical protein